MSMIEELVTDGSRAVQASLAKLHTSYCTEDCINCLPECIAISVCRSRVRPLFNLVGGKLFRIRLGHCGSFDPSEREIVGYAERMETIRRGEVGEKAVNRIAPQAGAHEITYEYQLGPFGFINLFDAVARKRKPSAVVPAVSLDRGDSFVAQDFFRSLGKKRR